MQMNGWQRLWLVASILWAVAILQLAGIVRPDNATRASAALVLRLWIVPVAAVYGLGLALAWVRRGFRFDSH